MKEAFQKCDTDHDGFLTPTETKDCAEKFLGRKLTKAEEEWGKELFEKDAGHDGKLGLKEFYKFAIAVAHKVEAQEHRH